MDLGAQVVDIKDLMQSFLKDLLIGEDRLSLTEVGIEPIVCAISEDVCPVKFNHSKSDVVMEAAHSGCEEVIEEVICIPEEVIRRITGNQGVILSEASKKTEALQ